MFSKPIDQVCSPPTLPPYLRSVYDLKPVVGAPSDDEVIGIHAVMRMAQKAVDIPGTGNPVLIARLAEHLFEVQMVKYRSKYDDAFPKSTTYTPPTLPSHVTSQLKQVIGTPSEEEIINVQDAIRAYNQFANVPSMFDPYTNMELSQHLFDIQMARYIQRSKNHDTPVHPPGLPLSSSSATARPIHDAAREEPATDNLETETDPIASPNYTMPATLNVDLRNSIQRYDRLVEQTIQLTERSNLLIERSNQIAQRANELAERSIQPTQQSNTLVEKFITLLGRLNEHFDQSNRIADQSMKRVKKLEDVLGNINRVLVGIQHAIVRNHKGNMPKAADCLVNERGDTPGQSSQLGHATFEWLSLQYSSKPNCQLPVIIEGTQQTLHIDDTWLGDFLRFYGVGEEYFESKTGTTFKAGYEGAARILFSNYLSSCLG
ncbi:unnamed protein product [Rhizoctonia solani]|uniref:Laminin domain protein n=1 Tax=Rhizoctonia solani TaxID=456999 RepID=A0A8H3D0L4_9AGAM|nr:unnamed protein product [Rhizoctonia solani]